PAEIPEIARICQRCDKIPDMLPLEIRLKGQARDLGFDLVGIAAASPADGFEHLCDWLERGFAGEMTYMNKPAQAREHPKSVLAGVHSVVMVGMNYKAAVSGQWSLVSGPERGAMGENAMAGAELGGKVASYARGEDYHDVLRARLKDLLTWLQGE